jgi:hypothetical protein
MVARNAIEVFDPALARRQSQLQHSGGAAPSNPHFRGIPLSREVEEKIMAALQAEARKQRQREEERRRRDPTYRPDAIDLSTLNLKPFDKYVDYYACLEVPLPRRTERPVPFSHEGYAFPNRCRPPLPPLSPRVGSAAAATVLQHCESPAASRRSAFRLRS